MSMRWARCSACARAATCRSRRWAWARISTPSRPAANIDGVLGTLAALEVVRTLNDAGIETELPICIVNWTNEEGSRFAPATMASAAYAGDYTTDDILGRKDTAGVTVGEALDGIGYRGDEPVGTQKFGAFVELHIEQGPLLEAENKTIGVVDRGQGIIWYDGQIVGFESHAGTTPMPLRRDALAALAEIVLAVERIAKAHGPNAVGTIGEAVIAAPSRNVIPGEIAFTVDIRSPAAETLDAYRQGFARGLRGNRRAAQGRSHARGDLAQAADRVRRQAGRCGRECHQGARLQPPPHHLRRRP